MNNALLCFLLVSFLAIAFADAAPPKSRTITNDGMTIQIPAHWTSKKVQDPEVFSVDDPESLLFLFVVREVKKEMGVEDLEEYFEFKLEKISDGWQDKRFGRQKSFILHNRKAILIDGAATVDEFDGQPATFYLMVVEGAEHYYLAYLLNPVKGGTEMPELRSILESLKVP